MSLLRIAARFAAYLALGLVIATVFYVIIGLVLHGGVDWTGYRGYALGFTIGATAYYGLVMVSDWWRYRNADK